MMTRTEPNSSFSGIQTSAETIEVIAAARLGGKRKVLDRTTDKLDC
jgi:hypothetical protein